MKKQDELELAGEGVAEATIDAARRILKLMQDVTSLSVVGEFLKAKNLHHSAGSWVELEEKRIIPFLRNNEITLGDLNRLLAEGEEYGRSHIFLFTAPKVKLASYIEPKKVARTCERMGVADALREIIIEELPEEPRITQIREELTAIGRAWVFKIVEKREQRTLVEETTDGDYVHKEV